MIHEPHGCFDQVSSTTFPMVFAINYLQMLGKSKENEKKIGEAKKYLQKGYKKLIMYECSMGGFTMFGDNPGDEYLTAYGYFQFKEFMKVGYI